MNSKAIGVGVAVVAALALVTAGIAAWRTSGTASATPEPDDDPAAAAGAQAEGPAGAPIDRAPVQVDGPKTIVFVVLDTVRAQNMQLCGYDRPNTPFMNKLRDQHDAFVSCHAYTPAAWTLPSHASFFTGQSVPEHELVQKGMVLKPELPTLAEIMLDRGYRTAMVSGNGILNEITGMQRGFEFVDIAIPGHRTIRGRANPQAVGQTLAEVGPDEPLFLFVNIFDAHDPYPAIPEGIPGVEAQPALRLFSDDFSTPDPMFTKFVNGEMGEEESTAFLEAARNGYDFGIATADRSLGGVFAALRKAGRLEGGLRVLITSDHGEFLGEHDNLRHGCFVYEEVTRVPLIYLDTTASEPFAFEGPLSATNAFYLLRDGHLPEEPMLPLAVSYRRPGKRPSADMVGIWATNTDKLAWMEGDYLRYDLEKDPGELKPGKLGDHELRPPLEEAAAWHVGMREKGVQKSAKVVEMLEQLGYIDN